VKLLLILVLLIVATLGGLVLFTWRSVRRVEASLPPQGRFVDVPGARLHVVDKGPAGSVEAAGPAGASGAQPARPALLLIHGLAGNLCNFTYGVVDRLATHYRVVAVDRPGSGYSVRASGASATLTAQADTMAALIDTLQLGRAVVVGHSLGGAVALALAQRHPERVAALALIAPLTHAPRAVSPAFAALQIKWPWLQHAVAWTLALPATLAQRDKILAIVFGPEPVPGDFATRGGGLLGIRPSHFVAACTDLADVPHDLPEMEARYPAMRVPVSVLYGRGDRILSPAEPGQGLADRLPGTRLVLVEGGHMLPVTVPDVTAAFVRDVAEGLRDAEARRT
jgi:pimeloyl-ACP methyl ester carboxylesterase